MRVAVSIEEAGRRAGEHAWVAARLFEATGRWSTAVDDPRARVLLGAASRRYGWHAELWHGLLPAVPHLAVDELVAAPDDLAPVLAVLDDLDAADDGDTGSVDATARLRALDDRVLPAVIDDLDRHLAGTAPVADGPAIRVLTLVLADLRADREALSSWSATRSRG